LLNAELKKKNTVFLLPFHALRTRTKSSTTEFETGSTEAHRAAQAGDLHSLERIALDNHDILHKEDINGWVPLHEAARGGHVEVVHFLHRHGADINKRTSSGRGGTALHLARQHHGQRHAVVQLLESLGALDIGPEL